MLGTSSHILICAGWILLLQGPQAGSLLQFPLHVSHLVAVKLSSPGAVKPSIAAPKPSEEGELCPLCAHVRAAGQILPLGGKEKGAKDKSGGWRGLGLCCRSFPK